MQIKLSIGSDLRGKSHVRVDNSIDRFGPGTDSVSLRAFFYTSSQK